MDSLLIFFSIFCCVYVSLRLFLCRVCLDFLYFQGGRLLLHQRVLLPRRHGVERDVLVLQVQFRDFLRVLRAVRDEVGAQPRDFHLAEPLADESQLAGGGLGEVDDVPFRERPAVGHLHDDLLAVDGVPHLQQRPEGVVHVGARHAVAVVRVAVAHCPSVQFVGIVAGPSRDLLLRRQVAGARHQQDAAQEVVLQCHVASV